MPCTSEEGLNSSRADLDLAVSHLDYLRPRERALLARTLSCEEDFVTLSFFALEKLAGRPLLARGRSARAWEPGLLLERAHRERELLGRYGIATVSIAESQYPPLLRELPDPPALLFWRGLLPDPELPLAAVVGTREPSAGGVVAARDFGRDLALCGISVVSGLARGIDAEAHWGNLEAGGRTVAVLGTGLDGVYPASNRPLARRILETGGCLLSEYPVGEVPRKWNFPARNRIIAGLARAAVVVEAPVKSGALITAEFAAEDGRDLWVPRAALESTRNAGGRALVSEGARVAEDAFAIAQDWGLCIPSLIEQKGMPEGFQSACGTESAKTLAEGLARSLHLHSIQE